jgi:hypothetical protein
MCSCLVSVLMYDVVRWLLVLTGLGTQELGELGPVLACSCIFGLCLTVEHALLLLLLSLTLGSQEWPSCVHQQCQAAPGL